MNAHLTIYYSPDQLDPNDTTTNAEKSLQNYFKEVEREIKKEYPDMEVYCYHYLGQSSHFSLRYEGDDRDEIMSRIQEITETVYEVGNFWE